MTNEAKKLEIFYDGLCPLCTKEINHYRKHPESHRIRFVDIASRDFDPTKEGLDSEDVHRSFHVKTPEGSIVKGVDGFVEIWKYLDIFKPLSIAAQSSLGRPFFNLGYDIFSKVRPIFRRDETCTEDVCQRV
jgi:predicted DCC family thiol-disulfide oxidoreductase YuxK